MTGREISVVLPLYNEEGNIRILYESLLRELESLTSDFEILFIDDGSKDQSLKIIGEITRIDERVLGISLSRNFGHQIALIAGLEHSKGNFVVMMDADMQHPADLIPIMYRKAMDGYDIVNTIRDVSKGVDKIKKSSSKWFYRFINSISEVSINHDSSEFRLMNRQTVDEFLKMKEKDRFMRGLIAWMGYKQTAIHYESNIRHSGKSKYSYGKMVSFAKDGIFSFSSRPLRFSFFIGIIISFLGLLYAGYAVVQYFLGNTVDGWASLMVVLLLLSGIQLLTIGVIGEYLARVFNEVKNRPLYFVKKYVCQDGTQ